MIGIENRRAVGRMDGDGVRRAGRHAVRAFRTSLKKQGFRHRTRRTQPIHPNLSRNLLRSRTIYLLDELLRCFDRRENGIFQKISPAI